MIMSTRKTKDCNLFMMMTELIGRTWIDQCDLIARPGFSSYRENTVNKYQKIIQPNSNEPEINSNEPEMNANEPEIYSNESEINSYEPEMNSNEPEINSNESEINSKYPAIDSKYSGINVIVPSLTTCWGGWGGGQGGYMSCE